MLSLNLKYWLIYDWKGHNLVYHAYFVEGISVLELQEHAK
jgi:hypothetical protein